MPLIPFPAIVADRADGIAFELLDRPFEGPRPMNPSWGVPPPALEGWFCPERGPEAAGIVAVSHARVFGSALVYVEAGGEPHALEMPQNFLTGAGATEAMAAMRARRDEGALRVRDIDGEVVLLSGFPYNLYGHWMVDFFPRLELLRMSGRDVARLTYLVPADLPAFAREWLALAGIATDRLVEYDTDVELCRCERALVPTNLRDGGRAMPGMGRAASWMTQIACRGEVAATRNLYVSRENWGNITRRLENFPEVEAVMGEYGFDVVFPEKLPISGQAELLASARIVAGDYGSGLHNTIFSRTGTPVVALRGTELHPGFLQSGLCEVRGQPLSYVFGRTWADEQGFQRYEIASDDLRRCLDDGIRRLEADRGS